MNERPIAIDKARARLEFWEVKFKELPPGKGTYDQHTQELADRLESVRIKVEKLARSGETRFGEAQRELERAFSELHTAWDLAVARLACTDSLAGHNPT